MLEQLPKIIAVYPDTDEARAAVLAQVNLLSPKDLAKLVDCERLSVRGDSTAADLVDIAYIGERLAALPTAATMPPGKADYPIGLSSNNL